MAHRTQREWPGGRALPDGSNDGTVFSLRPWVERTLAGIRQCAVMEVLSGLDFKNAHHVPRFDRQLTPYGVSVINAHPPSSWTLRADHPFHHFIFDHHCNSHPRPMAPFAIEE